MSSRPIFRTMEQHTFLIIYRGCCNKTGICIALSHFERVTINRFQKITVCQRFPNFSNIFPNFSQLEKLLKTNHIDPIVSMMNPARKAEFPTASDWFGSHVEPNQIRNGDTFLLRTISLNIILQAEGYADSWQRIGVLIPAPFHYRFKPKPDS